MKKFWLTHIESNIFFLLTFSILFPIYIHLPLLLIGLAYILWTKSSTEIDLGLSQICFLLFNVYTLVVSIYNQNILGVALPFLLTTVMFYLKHYVRWLDGEKYIKILMVYVLGSIPIALVNFLNFIHYSLRNEYNFLYTLKDTSVQFRPAGTFGNANLYGMFCLFAIVVGLYLMSKEKQFSVKTIYAFSIILNGISVILTASRMLIPSLVAGVLWFIFFGNRKYINATLLIIGVFFLFILIFPELLPRFDTTDLAILDRLTLWKNGWEVFESSPLFGRGGFSFLIYHWAKTGYFRTHSHQLLIELLASFGIIGVSMIMYSLRDYIQHLKEIKKNKNLQQEFALISSLILMVLIHSLVDVAFGVQPSFIFLSIVIVPYPVLVEVAGLQLDTQRILQPVDRYELDRSNLLNNSK